MALKVVETIILVSPKVNGEQQLKNLIMASKMLNLHVERISSAHLDT